MKRSWNTRSRFLCLCCLISAVAVLLAFTSVSCSTPTSETTTITSLDSGASSTTLQPDTTVAQTTTTAGAAETITVKVYFARDLKMAPVARTIPETLQVGAAAVQALLDGPTAEEEEAGLFSAIPEGTTFLGLTIDDGVAFVDLSGEYESGGGSTSFFVRLAQVVFTLTQFPTIDEVRFVLDGEQIDVLGGEGFIVDKPLGRGDYEEMSPAILVESPTFNSTVSSPLRITGTANVFEAVFQVNIVNWDGLIIAEEMVMASSGTGTRGMFDVTVPFEVSQPGLGALVVFSESPEDGSQINVVEIPLKLE